MKRNYVAKVGMFEEIAFTIEADNEEAFKLIEAKLRFPIRMKEFYQNMLEARRSIHVVDDIIERQAEYVDADIMEYLQQ